MMVVRPIGQVDVYADEDGEDSIWISQTELDGEVDLIKIHPEHVEAVVAALNLAYKNAIEKRKEGAHD